LLGETLKVKRRMSGRWQGASAEKKFWRCNELVDNLLAYLSVKDVSELAKVH